MAHNREGDPACGVPKAACRPCRRTFASRAELARHERRVHRHPRDGGRGRVALPVAFALLLLGGGGGAYALYASGDGAPATGEAAFALDAEPRLGRADAPVVLVAFEDPSCPYCRVFHHDDEGPSTFDRLVSEHVADGTLRIYYKEYLAAMLWGRMAASVQECAFEQGNDHFWNVTSAYYRDAPRLTTANVREASFRYAAESGMDTADLDECLASGRGRARVETEMATGQSLGVGGTPSFFVFGPGSAPQLIVGPQPYETFAAAIERARGSAA